MLFLPYQVGGSLTAYAPLRPTADPTVEIRTATSTKVTAGTAASRDAVATTLAAGAQRGAYSLQLESGSNLTAGRRYLVSYAGSTPEFVRVRMVSGTTVTLWTPTVYDHPNGAAFEGTLLSYTLSAANADAIDDDWRAIWSWGIGSAGGTTQPPVELLFGVTRHWPANPVTTESLLRRHPELVKHVSADLDLGDVCERAWDMVGRKLSGSSIKIADYLGHHRLEEATYYAARLLCMETAGEGFEKTRSMLGARLDAEVASFAATTPADENRDNVISPHERSGFTQIQIQRRR